MWKIIYLEALENRTNLCTSPIVTGFLSQISKLHVFGPPGPVPKSNHNTIVACSPKLRKNRCDHYNTGALQFPLIIYVCSYVVSFWEDINTDANCSSLTNYCGKNYTSACAWNLEACGSLVFWRLFVRNIGVIWTVVALVNIIFRSICKYNICEYSFHTFNIG
jgi:hypothetical protein